MITPTEIILAFQKFDIMWAIVIFLSSVVIAEILNFMVKKYFARFASRTKTMYDDEIIHELRRPVVYSIVILGLFLAIMSLNFFSPYKNQILIITYVFSIFWIAYIITKFIDVFFMIYFIHLASKERTIRARYTGIFEKLIGVLIYIAAIIIIFKHFDIELSPIIASLGIGGLAIALALQDSLANFFSGFYIISDKSIKVGDYVELESGLKGYVDDISWRATRLKTPDNLMVIVPNSTLAKSVTVNYNAPDLQMKIFFPVGVSYDSDLDKVERVTLKVAKDVLKRLKVAPADFEPFIRYKEFGESSINFNVVLMVQDYQDRFTLRHEFMKALKKAYDKNKIDIPYPIRTVYLKKRK